MPEIEIQETEVFSDWLMAMRDRAGAAVIARRLRRLARGALGDVKAVGEGISELRIDYGPGYRVYFARRGAALVILLCGGDKGSQARDIRRAKAMVKEL